MACAFLALWPWLDDPRFTFCFTRRFLHFSCPGCGLTRAFGALSKGQIGQAFRLHPLAPLLAAEAVLLWLGWGLVLLGRLKRPTTALINTWLIVHAIVLVAVWSARAVAGKL